MSINSRTPLANGSAAGDSKKLEQWNKRLEAIKENGAFHGDKLLADRQITWVGLGDDLRRVLTAKNLPEVFKVVLGLLRGKGLDVHSGAQLIGSLSDYSKNRETLIENAVKGKYDAMLHPPLSYLGDAFRYRAPSGKYNSALNPHLGAAGTPYAKTVPSKTHPLGALPDPGDIFEKLMARKAGGRDSKSGLSSMLIYHATIIIHDIFRTNDNDKNISDTSSYLDLSPLYGYTEEMQRKVRDDKFRSGLLKPDTFAEDRLLRQPPGVCIMLVMYNRYHNYAATQIKRINENGRFSIPAMYEKTKLLATADSPSCVEPDVQKTDEFKQAVKKYDDAWRKWWDTGSKTEDKDHADAEKEFSDYLDRVGNPEAIATFGEAHDACQKKLDDDLFQTARLITCGMYINVSIHDYLRALMGFHQYDTNFTFEPRTAMNHKNVSRGLGNQVTVEFNLMYRFHCAISRKDETYTENLMKQTAEQIQKMMEKNNPPEASKPSTGAPKFDPKDISMMEFYRIAELMKREETAKDPWLAEFGLKDNPTNPHQCFKRNTITGLFDDQQMINELCSAMEDPISNFGPRNVPRCLKNVEIMGIFQARKWEIGTLNDFRDFFQLGRHETFESITKNPDIQNALRDLYDHPDKVELYPGIFCESDETMNVDPGPSGIDSALWSAIFSDAITLVRSDRFYTVDWNTNSLTSWGMKEVTAENEICKSSVFHRLLQRAFPEWYPFDSIRFFHPFYTGEQNALYAKQQGYAPQFKIKEEKIGRLKTFDTTASTPTKPEKPIYLTKYDDIKKVLETGAGEIIHPAFADPSNLPPKINQALQYIRDLENREKKNKKNGKRPHQAEYKDDLVQDKSVIEAYFGMQMRRMVEREVIPMKVDDAKDTIYQLDATRDLAIPVITRCIADFLGFGDQVKDVGNLNGKYSENEVYQHITNCQTFLSYNADETKLLKRRTEFKKSMDFLLKLAEEGNILEASRWRISKAIRTLGKSLASIFKKRVSDDDKLATEPMKALGQAIAARILEDVKDTGKAAAFLLLTALDVAYVSVLAFTVSLDHLLDGAYTTAKADPMGTCDWFEIQKKALEHNEAGDKFIESKVKEAQRVSVKLPFIRKVVTDNLSLTIDGKNQTLKKGQIIVCDIFKAMNPENEAEVQKVAQETHLNYASSLSTKIIHFNPKDIAFHGLCAMITATAQMKDFRRGHTSQGFVKKIEIDQSYEGYANYMAPGRMRMIANDALEAPKVFKEFENIHKKILPPSVDQDGPTSTDKAREFLKQRVIDAGKVFNQGVLKPSQETYLSPEWDEMVPFPNTWKVRFDGYGASTYTTPYAKSKGQDLDKLRPDPLPDSVPPFYQPSGPSHYGGAFAQPDPQIPDNKPTPAEKVGVSIGGCGAPLVIPPVASDTLGEIAIQGKRAAASVGE